MFHERATGRGPLGEVLLRPARTDEWTIEDATKGTLVLGASGSGKTSGSGAEIARAFLSHGFGGLVLCAKAEERQLWERYARETGRESSLVVVRPGGPYRFNFIDYEYRRTGQTETIIALLAAVAEMARGKAAVATGADFWESSRDVLIRNASELLSLAQKPITLDAICELVASAPESPRDVGDPAWRSSSFCAATIDEAQRLVAQKGPRERHDFEIAARYWLKIYAAMADRTRSGVVATLIAMADQLLHGDAWELLCTDTTLVPEATYRDGAVILLDWPTQRYGKVGRLVQCIFKYCWQRSILARTGSAHTRPNFIYIDEAPNFLLSSDHQFHAECRGAICAPVYLAQNISAFRAVLEDYSNADTLLANFQNRIFHANGDPATNRWASDVIAGRWGIHHNFSVGDSNSGQVSGGGSEGLRDKVLPSAFTTLRQGGARNGGMVEAYMVRNDPPWNATGDIYLRTAFRQR